jgi:GT2 family glycosyltransferase/peptidoglycan/xylan/chitin deacetylase (PgdA/CDA1 family)
MYHSISPDPEPGVPAYFRTNTSPVAFRRQMEHLVQRGYSSIDLPQMVEILQAGQPRTLKSVIITFDDGFRDFRTEALPILREYGLTATIFLPTAYIQSTTAFFQGKQCLTWSEVRELRRAGICFGSHTVKHPQLALLSWGEVEREVRDSKTELEQQLGEPVSAFAHPFAFPQVDRHYVRKLRTLLLEAGYSCCVTTEIGRVKPGADPLRCRRLPINSLDDPELFQAKLEGSYDWVALAQAASKRVRALFPRSVSGEGPRKRDPGHEPSELRRGRPTAETTSSMEQNRPRLTSPAIVPTVSVIIVSWNAKKYLSECLSSLTADVCCYPMEIIVVDNASSDGSAEAVQKDFPHVKLIRNSANLGFGAANNIGIAASSGNYLCLVNSDVKVLPNCISRLVNYCEKQSGVGMVGPRLTGRDGKLQRSCRGFPDLWNMLSRAAALDTLFPKLKMFTGYSLTHWPQEAIRPVDILTGCFWLVRRQALNQVGPLDASFFMYGEDMDWCKRFWSHGWQVVFVPDAEAIHYGGASSSNAPLRFYIEMKRADLQYWAKHHSRAATLSYFLISCCHQLLRVVGYSLASLLVPRKREQWQYNVRRSTVCLKVLSRQWFVLVRSDQAASLKPGWPAPAGCGSAVGKDPRRVRLFHPRGASNERVV